MRTRLSPPALEYHTNKDTQMPTVTQLWLGDEANFHQSLTASAKAGERPEFKASSDYMNTVMEQFVQVQDGVAIVSMSGSLSNGSAGYGIYYGMLGYEDLRNILAQVVSNPGVSAIVLNVDSGGGAVAGVQETAQLLSRVNAVKPVVTYTGSMMASAAIWIGANASYVMASETAVVGSIGIIRVHMDYSESMKMDGIKATVIRAGEEKALASPYEPLSDTAKNNMQTQANQMYSIFIKDIAKARNIPVAQADTSFGQGKEFLGKAAMSVGLIDAVGSLEDAFAKAQKLGAASNASAKRAVTATKATNYSNVQANVGSESLPMADNQPTHKGTTMPKPLTDEQLAAMAAGVDLPTAEASAEADAAATTDAKAAADAASTNVAESTTKPEAPESAPDAMTVLTNLVTKATADTLAARLELQTAQSNLAAKSAEFDTLQTQANATLEIARASVKTMGLHFGLKAEAITVMSAAEVLAQHADLSEKFKAKFKVGGVAATTQEAVKPKASLNPMFAAYMSSSTAK